MLQLFILLDAYRLVCHAIVWLLITPFPFNRYGNANVWKTFTDLFDYFPLTALVSNVCFSYLITFKSFLLTMVFI